MKRVLIAMTAVLAGILGSIAAPAQAFAAHPPDINGYRFWSGNLCIDGSGIDGPYYRVKYIAQLWNLRVGDTSVLGLNYRDDCAAAGYPPSRRMVIGQYKDSNSAECDLLLNPETAEYDEMLRWTNGPAIYINVANLTCIGSQARRDHEVSSAIGYLLGLQELNSDAYDNRVMSGTWWSMNNVPFPDSISGQRVHQIYSDVYGG
ncbi:hypothetical protein [Kribbella deserti]|uniref:Uncharacterized protein n=1 Tax=Kribbella deserti TaxID=1926257 RepID=A0ABV6QQ10_9ACTN